MKRIILVIGIIFILSPLLHAQIETISVSYQSTEKNTYKYEYYDDGDGKKKVQVFNIYNPFEGQPGVEFNYRSFSKIIDPAKDLYDIVSEHLSPYLPAIVKPDQNISVFLDIGLDGKVGHVVFIHPQAIKLPVEAYEVVETAIKNEYRPTLFYDPAKIEGVYTVYSGFYDLESMKEDNFIPVSPGSGGTQPESPGGPGTTNPTEGVIP